MIDYTFRTVIEIISLVIENLTRISRNRKLNFDNTKKKALPDI